MRVAFVTDWFAPRRGGIESQLQGIAPALAARGVALTVITSQPDAQQVDGAGLLRLPCRVLPRAHVAVSPGLVGQVQRALQAARPDIVHLHPSIVAPTCLAGVIAARRLGLPVVLTFHSDMRRLAPLLALLHRWRGWADTAVTLCGVSHPIADQLRQIAAAQPVQILANGFDHAFWAEAGPAPYPKVGQPFRLVSALRLERTKSPFTLLTMLRAAPTDCGPVELVIAGEGSLRAALEQRARQWGLAGAVRFVGWQDRAGLRGLYRQAHAFVMPSLRESFGIATLEARAAGLPVIARAGTGMVDFIRHGQDGLLCPDDAGMAEALHRLRQQPDLWQKLAGPRPDLVQFDWGRVAGAHLETYRQALSGHGI